eukprot:TRINITY_DN24706_c0_g1_i1.p1 TRINITY_DN24706_c0_g1~~TRINITY_DN24706_c0_g1_i1.p1  ORF type:complete len:900 (+),score=261.52 TRINITY_DN24706_c0_g1_i1:48-2702(+)
MPEYRFETDLDRQSVPDVPTVGANYVSGCTSPAESEQQHSAAEADDLRAALNNESIEFLSSRPPLSSQPFQRSLRRSPDRSPQVGVRGHARPARDAKSPEQTAEVDALRKQVREGEQRQEVLNAAAAQMRARMSEMMSGRGGITLLQKERDQAVEEKKQLESENYRLSEKIKRLRMSEARSANVLAVCEEALSGAQWNLEKQQQELARLRAELSTRKSTIEQCTEQISSWKTKYDAAAESLTLWKHQAAGEREDERDEQAAAVAAMEAELRCVREDASELRGQLDKARADLLRCEEERYGVAQRLRDAVSELDELHALRQADAEEPNGRRAGSVELLEQLSRERVLSAFFRRWSGAAAALRYDREMRRKDVRVTMLEAEMHGRERMEAEQLAAEETSERMHIRQLQEQVQGTIRRGAEQLIVTHMLNPGAQLSVSGHHRQTAGESLVVELSEQRKRVAELSDSLTATEEKLFEMEDRLRKVVRAKQEVQVKLMSTWLSYAETHVLPRYYRWLQMNVMRKRERQARERAKKESGAARTWRATSMLLARRVKTAQAAWDSGNSEHTRRSTYLRLLAGFWRRRCMAVAHTQQQTARAVAQCDLQAVHASEAYGSLTEAYRAVVNETCEMFVQVYATATGAWLRAVDLGKSLRDAEAAATRERERVAEWSGRCDTLSTQVEDTRRQERMQRQRRNAMRKQRAGRLAAPLMRQSVLGLGGLLRRYWLQLVHACLRRASQKSDGKAQTKAQSKTQPADKMWQETIMRSLGHLVTDGDLRKAGGVVAARSAIEAAARQLQERVDDAEREVLLREREEDQMRISAHARDAARQRELVRELRGDMRRQQLEMGLQSRRLRLMQAAVEGSAQAAEGSTHLSDSDSQKLSSGRGR